MTNMRWFGGKGRDVKNVYIVDYVIISLSELDSSYILLAEVSYHDRTPNVDQLVIAFTKIDMSLELPTNYLSSLISLMSINDQEGFLYDAIYVQKLQQAFINNKVNNSVIKQKNDEPVFSSTLDLESYVLWQFDSTSRIGMVEYSNTSIAHGETFFLKNPLQDWSRCQCWCWS